MKPKQLNKTELIHELRKMIAAVETHDSSRGSIEYTETALDTFDVCASIRVDDGVAIIGEPGDALLERTPATAHAELQRLRGVEATSKVRDEVIRELREGLIAVEAIAGKKPQFTTPDHLEIFKLCGMYLTRSPADVMTGAVLDRLSIKDAFTAMREDLMEIQVQVPLLVDDDTKRIISLALTSALNRLPDAGSGTQASRTLGAGTPRSGVLGAGALGKLGRAVLNHDVQAICAAKPQDNQAVGSPAPEVAESRIAEFERMRSSLKGYMPLCDVDVPAEQAHNFWWHLARLTDALSKFKHERNSHSQELRRETEKRVTLSGQLADRCAQLKELETALNQADQVRGVFENIVEALDFADRWISTALVRTSVEGLGAKYDPDAKLGGEAFKMLGETRARLYAITLTDVTELKRLRAQGDNGTPLDAQERMELNRLREREKLCESMDKAEKFALIRALQEIGDVVGLLGDGVTPRQIVENTVAMRQRLWRADNAVNEERRAREAAEARVKEFEAAMRPVASMPPEPNTVALGDKFAVDTLPELSCDAVFKISRSVLITTLKDARALLNACEADADYFISDEADERLAKIDAVLAADQLYGWEEEAARLQNARDLLKNPPCAPKPQANQGSGA